MASLIEQGRSQELMTADASGQLVLPSPITVPVADSRPRRKSRWPARLDILQSASGLFLALFLMAHMFFVSSILISRDAFYTVARFFEGAYFLGKPYPILVSGVVTVILVIFIVHAWLAMRKFPAGYRQYRAFITHKNGLRHGDTSLWWLQIWTGFALFFMASIHLYDMLTQPSLIGPFESADRVWTGNMWPLYLMLLFAAELHASVGLYRLAIKWGWFAASKPNISRRRLLWAKHSISAFFITLGLVSLAAYVDLGRSHADRAGERYVPTHLSAPLAAGKH
ncbi:MAG: fumarate reductase cytochrome b subunit [Azonexus sp.]|nr:fumarate reductase cytochrome b subunit [Azonexus sp.]